MAPPGVKVVRLCRYSRRNQRAPLTLTSSKLITSTALVGQLQRAFDALRPQKGPIACPVDNGSRILARLRYPDRHEVTISVGLAGCETVTNGNLSRIALGPTSGSGPELVARLEQLLDDPAR